MHRLNRSGEKAKLPGFQVLIVAILVFDAAGASASVSPAPPPPGPDDGTNFDLYVADQITSDNNIFRIPANFGPVATTGSPNASRGDVINSSTLGADGQLIVGRQDFALNVRADYNRFSRNTNLDNTSFDGKGAWNWRVTGYFSGALGGEFNKSLASFGETRFLGRDLVNTSTYFGNGRFQLGPRWAIIGDIRASKITHDALDAQYNNFRTKSGDVGVEYATNINDTFALDYSYGDGAYPSNTFFQGALFDRDFHDSTTRFLVKYSLTDKTLIDAYAGYLRHELIKESKGAFAGTIWRFKVDWRPTDKTQIAAATWHELHAYLVNQSDYFLSKGVSLAPAWLPTEKITLSLIFSLEDQSYTNAPAGPNSPAPITSVNRYDKVVGDQLNLVYMPRTNWIFNVFFRHENRNSNEAAFSYVDNLVNASVTFKFF